jgi:hypothetical protein
MTALMRPAEPGLTEADPSGPRRLLRIRPAPRRDPPFDDEVPVALRAQVGPHDRQLPFDTGRPEPVEAARPTANVELPDPAGWARRLLVGVVETAAGRRPLQQLTSLLSASVAYGLRADFERCAQNGRRHWIGAAVIRSVRASEPADRVAELSATLLVDGRVRAVALRLEARDGRWLCTRLQLG